MPTSVHMSKLEELQQKGLVPAAVANIKKWLENKEYAAFFSEIEQLILEENIDELNNSFYQVIPFGTGGRRGKMGPGPNRMNTRTIAESAQGVADYLLTCFSREEVEKRGVVITYDVRHNSRLFAEVAAGVFAANGLTVYFFDGVRSTPQISFTIRYKNAIAGAMISASHNPPADNGIKIYWTTGGQVVPPDDAKIITHVQAVTTIEQMDFQEGVASGRISMLGEEVDNAYKETVGALSLGPYRDVHIVFTPLHGCASTSFLPVLRSVGFHPIELVEEQMSFDPDFTNVAKHIPNPEVPSSLDRAIAQAKATSADIVLASDPDADRIGVVSRESLNNTKYIFLNGNQIGVLVFDYIIRQRANSIDRTVMMKTVVTTELLTKIAEDNAVDVIGDLPVGFKYIADAMEHRLDGREFLFGAEESHGFLYGDYARDKDGAVGALLICEYAALLKKEGRTLFEQLEYIKKQYGYYRELLQAIYYHGMDGMEKMLHIMKEVRANLPKEIGGYSVHVVLDQREKKCIDPAQGNTVGEYVGFPDNALVFYLNKEKSMRVVVRPSGTEPKIKFYVAVGKSVGQDKTWEEYAEIKKEVDALAHQLLGEFIRLAETYSPGGEKSDILG